MRNERMFNIATNPPPSLSAYGGGTCREAPVPSRRPAAGTILDAAAWAAVQSVRSRLVRSSGRASVRPLPGIPAGRFRISERGGTWLAGAPAVSIDRPRRSLVAIRPANAAPSAPVRSVVRRGRRSWSRSAAYPTSRRRKIRRPARQNFCRPPRCGEHVRAQPSRREHRVTEVRQRTVTAYGTSDRTARAAIG